MSEASPEMLHSPVRGNDYTYSGHYRWRVYDSNREMGKRVDLHYDQVGM